MKKVIILSLVILISLSAFTVSKAQEQHNAVVYFFYGSTCPICKKAGEFLQGLIPKYDNLTVVPYEVYNSRDNAKLLMEFLGDSADSSIRVPAIFINGQKFVGYASDETTGQKIEQAIQYCLANECGDPREVIIRDEKPIAGNNIIDVPFIGEVNLSKFSLPVITVIVAAVDGFNPCAMWVLMFLLALLINVKSRKRIWLIAGTFILASGLVYFLLLSAWLNLFLAISYVTIIRVVIGILAVAMGLWQLKRFKDFKEGVCEIAPDGSIINTKLTNTAERVVGSRTLALTLLGIIGLAFGVNLVEFFCSAGLPAIYTSLLSMSELSGFSYYLYIALYTFVFMLDDMLVFAIALITLSKIGFTNKYAKWSTLIGALFILLLGLAMLFRPDLLIFG